MQDEASKVSDFWGDEKVSTRQHNWLQHPVARACINLRVSGDITIDTAEHWRRNYLNPPAMNALSIGCGFGNFERGAISGGLALQIDANDVSAMAVARAVEYAAMSGMSDKLSYSVFNLNSDKLPESRYDAIFGISSIHHVSALEKLFKGCRQALRPNGLLFMDEYIGPTRFQSGPVAVKIINDLLAILPAHYRQSAYLNGEPRNFYENPSVNWFEEHDPSEAVRSDEILEVLQDEFEVVEIRPYGGAILHMLLSGTAGNYDPENPADIALLKVLAMMEQRLEEAGVLRPDFASIVARPRRNN